MSTESLHRSFSETDWPGWKVLAIVMLLQYFHIPILSRLIFDRDSYKSNQCLSNLSQDVDLLSQKTQIKDLEM